VKLRVVKRIPAHDKALNAIEAIKVNKHTDNQEGLKEYYTSLTDTLREYIVNRFGFNAMEMTSSEIIERLRNTGDQKMIDELKELFQTADLVKFAKYETLINENDANLVNAVKFIDETKTDEVEKEEKVAPTLSETDMQTRQNRKVLKTLISILTAGTVALMGYIIYQLYLLMC
jgi:RNA-binding protein YhbY